MGKEEKRERKREGEVKRGVRRIGWGVGGTKGSGRSQGE